MTVEHSKFLIELESISRGIANWAEKQLASGCRLDEVKRKLRQVMIVCERN